MPDREHFIVPTHSNPMKTLFAIALTAVPSIAATLDPAVLVRFNGSVSGTTYTLGVGEFDDTSSFKANGTPTISAGTASLDGGTSNDGFDFNPTSLGTLTTQNWVAEAIISFDAFESGQRTMIDVQGDTDLRVHSTPTNLQAGYWDGSTFGSVTTPIPATGTSAHYALVWDAAASSLTAYVNGVSIGTVNNNAYAVPDASNVSFGYLGRSGFDNRSIDGLIDSVSFATFTGTAFDPATDFQLFTPPPPVVYHYWDTDVATPGSGGSAPGGNWGDANWSPSSLGDAATAAWTADWNAAFSAGADATSPFTVDLGATTREAGSVLVEEGDVTLANGTLDIATGGSITAASGAFLEISANLTAGDLQTTGNILLSGNPTVSGGLTAISGQLTSDAPLSVGTLAGAGGIGMGANNFTFGSATDSSYTGLLAGSGTMTKQGSGSQTLGNVNNGFSGPLVVAAGTLVTGPGAGSGTNSYLGQVDGSRTVSVQSGATLRLTQANVFGGGGKTAATIPSYQIDGGTLRTVRFNIIGNTTLSNGASLANASTETAPSYGGFQLLGDVTVSAGPAACQILDDGSTRPIHLPGSGTTTFNVADITASADADLVVSSDLTNGSGDYPGVGALTKAGSGTLSLTGTNTYTGTTTVTAGTLAVNGTALADSSSLVIDGGVIVPTGTETVDNLFFGATQQAAGTWGATGSGATHIDDARFSGTAGVLLVTTGPLTGYALWASTNAPTGTPTDDYDGDGVTNALEWVLGGSATTNDLGKLPTVGTAGGNLTFTFVRDDAAWANGATVDIQVGTDLANWPDSYNVPETPGVYGPVTVTDNGGTDTVTLTVTQTPDAKKFARLKAVVTP